GADEAGSHRDRDDVEVTEPYARTSEGLLRQRVEPLDVRPGGDLGHHATEAHVQIDLARDEVRTDREAVFDHRDGRLVARGLDAEGDHAGRTPSGRPAAISARRHA